MSGTGRTAAGLLASALLLVPAGGGLSGQEVSLETVESLVQAGRTEEARSILGRWSEAVEGNAPRLDIQRAIWLRAILTVDPDLAAQDFRRLVVEFPGGGWTDRALLRLAQYAEARGDVESAARQYRTLARDYPGSPSRLEARTWLDENAGAIAAAERRAELELARSVTPPEPIEDRADPSGTADARARTDSAVTAGSVAGADAEPDVREGAPPAAEVDTARASLGKSAGYVDPPSDATPDTAGAARGDVEVDSIVDPIPIVQPTPVEEPEPGEVEGAALDFTVQLGAFAADGRARELLRRAEEAGFEARLASIPGSELVRVRVGRFPDPEEATRVYDRLIESGFDAVVVADAAREEPPR